MVGVGHHRHLGHVRLVPAASVVVVRTAGAATHVVGCHARTEGAPEETAAAAPMAVMLVLRFLQGGGCGSGRQAASSGAATERRADKLNGTLLCN